MIYADAVVPVRTDLTTAHVEAMQRWAAPGSQWNGPERLAIAAVARQAHSAPDGPAPWVSASSVEGLVDADGVLPDAAVDAAWRLAAHPGTLTADWIDSLAERGLDPLAYVELVGIVATTVCLRVFAEAVGATTPELPDAHAGEPHGRVSDDIAVSTHWVPTTTGPGPMVGKAVSALPDSIELWMSLSEAQYVPFAAVSGDLTWNRGTISRRQIELLAARTSMLNECFY